MKTTKKSYPSDEPVYDNDQYNRIENELEEASKRATETNLIGFLFESPVGDGQAKYRVTEDKGGENITLQHINIGDAWTLPPAHLRGLRRQDLLDLMSFNRIFYSGQQNSKI